MKSLMIFIAVLSYAAESYGTTYFSDDFDDGNADGWVEISMIEYEVVDGMYYFHGGYQENHGISFNGDNLGFMSVPDYSASCRVILETGYFIGMLIRFREDVDYNLMLLLCPPEQKLRLYRWYWSGTILLDQVSFPVNYDEEYWLRFEVEDDLFRGKAWSGDPGDEPSSWMVSTQDSSVTWPGSLGLFCVGINSRGKASLSGRFDDVTVTDPIQSILSSGTWACLKRLCFETRQ
jgi:hypothetical protein